MNVKKIIRWLSGEKQQDVQPEKEDKLIQDIRTEKERVIDAIKTSMREEGRWEVSWEEEEVLHRTTQTKEDMWLKSYTYSLVDKDTGWGIVAEENCRHGVYARQKGRAEEDYISHVGKTRDKQVKLGIEEVGETPSVHTLNTWFSFKTTGCENNFFPDRAQLRQLVEYWGKTFHKPRLEMVRLRKEQKEIEAMSRLYLTKEE